jgi:hypothetical protein
VFRGARLGQAEPLGELADQVGAFEQQVEDLPPRGFRQHVEAHATEYTNLVICLQGHVNST